MRVSVLVFASAIILLASLVPWLVELVYRISDPEMIRLVQWLLAANFLLVVNTLFRSWFKVISKTGSVMVISIVQVAFFSISGSWLLSNFQLNGVALGIGLSQVLSVLISVVYWMRYANYSLSTR